jgi:hypothetical protein
MSQRPGDIEGGTNGNAGDDRPRKVDRPPMPTCGAHVVQRHEAEFQHHEGKAAPR